MVNCLAFGCAAAEFTIVPGLSDEQKGIFIKGVIEYGDDEEFFKLAEQAERASVILESPGGNVLAGLGIGAEIAIRGFTTLVVDGEGCFSICAVIWASGVRRYMTPNATIGVHAAYRIQNLKDGTSLPVETGAANADIGAFLNELGLSREAIRYFTTASPNDFKFITPDVAQTLSIDVYIQDGFEITSAAYRPTPRKIARQTVDYLSMAVNCSNLLDVSEGFFREQAKEILEGGHTMYGGETFADLLPQYTDPTKVNIERQGFVRWCIEAESRLRGERLPTGISGPSFECSKAATPTENAICSSKDLWVMDRIMGSMYFFLRDNTNSQVSQQFLESQREWIKRRNHCGSDLPCLLERYSSRLFDLGAN